MRSNNARNTRGRPIAVSIRLLIVWSPPLATFSRPTTAASRIPSPSHTFLKGEESLALIITPAWSFSQIRGTAKKSVGWTSRKLACTVSMDSAKLTVRPISATWKVEKIRSATWHSGR